MPLNLDDFIGALRDSRKHFLRHLEELTPEQLDWKPYPECKSIRETVAHLICDGRAAVQALETGHEPDYDLWEEPEQDMVRLLQLLQISHDALCKKLEAVVGDELDKEICIWGA